MAAEVVAVAVMAVMRRLVDAPVSLGADRQLEMATSTSRVPSSAANPVAAAALQVKLRRLQELGEPCCVALSCLGCSSPDPVSFG